MSDDGKLHYEAWCEADVRGYGPPWESVPPLLRALHDRVAALFIKRVGAERDAAIAERDRLRARLEERARAGAGVAFELKELQDEVDGLRAERDRLRRELEALRLHVVELARLSGLPLLDDVADDIGGILRGES